MKITPDVFEAFLKCPTKSWLRATGEPASGNAYAEWVKTQTASYRAAETQRLVAESPQDETAVSPAAGDIKTAKWRLASNVLLQAQMESCVLESELHAVERVPSEGRGRPAQFVPIRFVFTNKLGKDDKLLLAFDAFVLSAALGREIAVGKIVHGDRGRVCGGVADSEEKAAGMQTDVATAALSRAQPQVAKVKTAALTAEVRKRIEKLATLLASQSPPDLVLNRHCGECEFRDRCRQKAVEKDDLSLLAGMSEKERKKLHSKGIFTVTQLSYTFRPRRRPKRLRDKREKYHHSLKALAIREKKIHIVGSPELKIEGTPVYLDVEGLPDRDFYYLIGLRIGNGDSAVQHSLWADTVADEGKIWRQFLAILETVEKPVLIHYGSYESSFLNRMCELYGEPLVDSPTAKAIKSAVNLLSVVFAQVYFPSFSNGLKEIGGFLGFVWSNPIASGLLSVTWRKDWDKSKTRALKQRLLAYNSDDCQALELLVRTLIELGTASSQTNNQLGDRGVVAIDSLKAQQTLWSRFSSPIAEFEQINKAAHWDYQRDRIYVRSSGQLRLALKNKHAGLARHQGSQNTVVYSPQRHCPVCHRKAIECPPFSFKTLHDISFGQDSLRKRIVQYRFQSFWCSNCRRHYGAPTAFWPDSRYGRNLVAYILYHIVELRIPQHTVAQHMNRLFGFCLNQSVITQLKGRAAEYYKPTQRAIIERIASGSLVHVDETRANVRGAGAYVWVFTNLHQVAYLYADSREGSLLQATLGQFKGVLVSDFYSVYDSVACPQQKCLLHLMRDLNDELLDHPYDEELKQIVRGFAELLKPMVETIDWHGLKTRYLRKHLKCVEHFYRQIEGAGLQSEAALKCKERFVKNRGKLFTFLEHDDVPWNNNNAEHAIKAFAALREQLQGSSTQKGIEEYLTLMSVCQTCKYMGVDFLDFLRSGEKDIHAFAESRRGRRHRSATSQSKAPPVAETVDT